MSTTFFGMFQKSFLVERLAEKFIAAFFIGSNQIHDHKIVIGIVKNLQGVPAFGFDWMSCNHIGQEIFVACALISLT